jgi:hydrogenase expression/formation protein HypC
MCLAVPAKILSFEDDLALVDYGSGVSRKVNIMLVDAEVGDFVLVHAGYAIKVLDEKEAQETLSLWKEILSLKTE